MKESDLFHSIPAFDAIQSTKTRLRKLRFLGGDTVLFQGITHHKGKQVPFQKVQEWRDFHAIAAPSGYPHKTGEL